MRTVAALAIAALGSAHSNGTSAALFAASLAFPWLGVAVVCLALSIAVLTSNPTTYRR